MMDQGTLRFDRGFFLRAAGPDVDVRSKYVRGRFLVFLLLFSGFFSMSNPGSHAQVNDKWDLWSGQTQLRGANVIQRRVHVAIDADYLGPGPMGAPFTQADFDQLAAYGANYVNISYSGLYTEKPPYTVDQDIQNGLDQMLAMIARADMFAVISFRSGPGRSEFALYYWTGLDAAYFDDSMWQDQAAQDAWAAMWRYTAQRYRDNPIVVGYDLMVEPNSNDSGADFRNAPLEIWEPDDFYTSYGGTLYDWNRLYPSITAAIREVDTRTPILIGGNGYSGVRWLPYVQPTTDTRTVYCVHQYEPQDQYTHIASTDPNLQTRTYPGVFDVDADGLDDQFNRNWLDGFLSPIDTFKSQHNVPVAANEFGVNRWVLNAADFMRDTMDLFEQRGMNHALWEWQPEWPPLNADDDMNFRHGPDPANHANLTTGALIAVIRENWSRNTIRPSTFATAVLDFYLYE